MSDRFTREQFADDLEASGSELCDCDPDGNPPVHLRTKARLAHHCECAAVVASAAIRHGESMTRHARECLCGERGREAKEAGTVNELIEFLTAQIDEDEAVARAILGDGPGIWAVADDPHGTYMEVLGALRADAKPGDGYWHAGLVTWVLDSMTDYRGFPLDPDEIRPTYLALATHIARHDPAGALREVATKRQIVEWVQAQQTPGSTIGDDFVFPLYAMANAYDDRPGWKERWRV